MVWMTWSPRPPLEYRYLHTLEVRGVLTWRVSQVLRSITTAFPFGSVLIQPGHGFHPIPVGGCQESAHGIGRHVQLAGAERAISWSRIGSC